MIPDLNRAQRTPNAVNRLANWNGMCVAIVGPSVELVYFEKQDNCRYSSIIISQHKARVAARYRRPTRVST
jgi:glc operon protein GlcG